MLNGHWRGRELGSCTDCWHYNEELRARTDHRGRVRRDRERDVALERPLHDDGHRLDDGLRDRGARADACPAAAAIPAVDSRRAAVAEAAGGRSSSSSSADLKPSDILTRAAFENAIRVLHAISGSTNAILHLIAYAGRVGVDLPLSSSTSSAASTPWLVDLKPAGPAPDGGLLLRGRPAGGDGADRRPARPRRAHGHRPDLGENLAGSRPRSSTATSSAPPRAARRGRQPGRPARHRSAPTAR